jgi:GT2 family glycosyltransferase
MMTNRCLSVVIVNWNAGIYLLRCVESIGEAVDNLPCQVIVVDNASSDGSIETLQRDFAWVTIIRNAENLGFGRANNVGLAQCQGEFVALVNPDVILGADSLVRLVRFLEEHPNAALVGPRILSPDGSIQSKALALPGVLDGCRNIPILARAYYRSLRKGLDNGQIRRCGWVFGACMVFRRAMLKAIGGIPTDTFMYGEEIMIGHALKREGCEVWYNPGASVCHYHAISTRRQPWSDSQKTLLKRAARVIAMRKNLSWSSFLMWDSMMLVGTLWLWMSSKTRSQKVSYPYGTLINLYLTALWGRLPPEDRHIDGNETR